jgi:Na+/proline symporter
MVTLMPTESASSVPKVAAGANWLPWVIVLFGGIVVVYTLIGGLWAVLVVDVLQFIVLNLAVTFVVILSAMKMGSLSGFVAAAPQGFFAPVAGGYTWFFLVSWCAIHFFVIGAEWAFVQRYICVPSEADARKGAFLFGALYLISPFVWMLPPMIWRIQNPIPDGASPEQIQALAEVAYIQSCRAVLPIGMIGMMMAAMFSATASTVSAQLNVFAGVLTNDIYKPLVGPQVDEQRLVRSGCCSGLVRAAPRGRGTNSGGSNQFGSWPAVGSHRVGIV